ncbi:hypothetical protein [Planctomyces sp. SH-PL62]|uniref:hypothetical protein n=1 Tax=Planctomyces sp. SH-PL62 TaxID=1636152 RepID=UPI0012E7910B|nr:hypothetical protein [Planctomyces sp. SH-PL62]
MAEAGRKAAGRPRGDRDDVPVKLDRSLVDRARVVAAYKKTTLAELLSVMLKGPVDRAYAQMAKDLTKPAAKASKDAGKERGPTSP